MSPPARKTPDCTTISAISSPAAGLRTRPSTSIGRRQKLDPHFYLGDYNEGLLLERKGATGTRSRRTEIDQKRKPGFPLSRFHLGFLYEKGGNNSGAVTEYSKALRIDPSCGGRRAILSSSRPGSSTALLSPITMRDLAGADLVGEGEIRGSCRLGKAPAAASGEHERARA